MSDRATPEVVDGNLLANMLATEKRRLLTESCVGEFIPRNLLIVLLAAIAWGQGNNTGVTIWTVTMLVLPGPAAVSPRWLDTLSDRMYWLSTFVVSGVAFPIGWSLLPMLVPTAGIEVQFTLLIIISTVLVVRSQVSAYHPPEMYAQVFCGFGVLVIWQVIRGGVSGWGMAFFLVLLASGLIGYGRAVHRGLVRAVTLNAQNLQLASKLEQANVAKTRFLASASHDLRQPLHTLGLLVGLLNPHIEKSQNRAVLERIQGSLNSMEVLLNGILDVSRLDAGVEVPNMGPVSVEQLWQYLDRSFAADAARRGLKLRLRPSRLWLVSDAHLLLRILNNLVSNALRYTPQGGVLVSARERGKEIWLEVRDSGVGIDAEHLDRVFEEFVQLDNPHRDRNKGMGLGLAIVKRTADLLNHALDVRSRPGRGTCFRLRLQRMAVPIQQAAKPAQTFTDVSGLFVLVIDDEQEIRYAMQGLLSDWGCLVVTASNGDEALAILESRLRPPEAIVVDYRLQGLNGLQVTKCLTEALGTQTPALIVTGDVTAEPLKAIQESGLPVLHKPVNSEKLRAWLGEVKAGLPQVCLGEGQ